MYDIKSHSLLYVYRNGGEGERGEGGVGESGEGGQERRKRVISPANNFTVFFSTVGESTVEMMTMTRVSYHPPPI